MLVEDDETQPLARKTRKPRGGKMTSTRQHLAHLLKYYPRRPCAPSLIKSRFFRITTIYLLTLYLHLYIFEIPYMYTRGGF